MWALPYLLETQAEISKDEMMRDLGFASKQPSVCGSEVGEGTDAMSMVLRW